MKIGVFVILPFLLGFSTCARAQPHQPPKYCDMDARTGVRIQSSIESGPMPFEVVSQHTLCFKPVIKHFEYIIADGMCFVYIPGPGLESYMAQVSCTPQVQKLAKT